MSTTNPLGPMVVNTNPTNVYTGNPTVYTGLNTGLSAGTSGTLPPSVIGGYTQFDPMIVFAIVIGVVAVVLTIIIVTCLVCWCNRRADSVQRQERILLETRQLKQVNYKNRIINDSPIIQEKVQPPAPIIKPPAYEGPPPISFHVISEDEPTTQATPPTCTPLKFSVATQDVVTKTTAGLVQCAQCGLHKSSANLVQCQYCGHGGTVQKSTTNLVDCAQCSIHKSEANLVECEKCRLHKSETTLVECAQCHKSEASLVGCSHHSHGALSTIGGCQTGCETKRYSHVQRIGPHSSHHAKHLHGVDDCGCNGRSVLQAGNTTFLHHHAY